MKWLIDTTGLVTAKLPFLPSKNGIFVLNSTQKAVYKVYSMHFCRESFETVIFLIKLPLRQMGSEI